LKRDIENFKALGINTVRIYTIDNSQSHKQGMKMLADAGIYLALDANTPKYSLNRENAGSLHASYNDVYLQSVFATVDEFAQYDNLLLLFSGNEVINDKTNTNAAPYIKAVTRDMKAYIKSRKYRQVPVGYSSADVAENIEQQALYFDCGSDDERADFFAFNDYSWCEPSNFVQAGWDKKVETYKNYGKPIFLSEFGCITNKRTWGEIGALYSDKMTSVYSGGLVYEYTVEPNGYGLVEVGSGGKIQPNDDFDRLKAAYKKTPVPASDGGFRSTTKASQCPPADDQWEVSGTGIPDTPEPAMKLMQKGAGTGPGLSGEGSQWAGTGSKTTPSSDGGFPASTNAPGNAQQDQSGQQNQQGAGAANAAPMQFVGMMLVSVFFGLTLIF
jgi:hypothetical protein